MGIFKEKNEGIMNVDKTKVIGNYTIYKKNLNRHNTLFGGYILFWLDEIMGMTARKYSELFFVTASIDTYQFIDKVCENEFLKIKSYVSNVGKKSIEIFAEVTAYNGETRRERLVGTAFSTFSLRKDQVLRHKLEEIEYNTEIEKFVHFSHEERKNYKITNREFSKQYLEKYNKYYGA